MIVFVHLGQTLPDYLILNLEGTLDRFPGHQICLVTDQVKELHLDERVRQIKVTASTDWPLLAHDKRFWDDWWSKTFYRLLALEEAHREIGTGPLLHIESDVFLSNSFPFATLKNHGELAWPSHIGNSDIASVLYSPSAQHTKVLVKQLKSLVSGNPKLTDMTALNLVRSDSSVSVTVLSQDPGDSAFVSTFGGVFDGANFGSYIFGSDPAAKAGLVKRRKLWESSTDFLHGARFLISEGSAYMVTNQGEQVSIHNLHVHSKDLKFFDSARTDAPTIEITPTSQTSFSWRGLVTWLSWKPALLMKSIVSAERWRMLFGVDRR